MPLHVDALVEKVVWLPAFATPRPALSGGGSGEYNFLEEKLKKKY
jgi:hypothetical protein